MRDAARPPLHDAHHGVAAGHHEVDQRHAALVGVELGFQDQRAGTVAARDTGVLGHRRDAPTAVVRRAEQGGERGRAVEARPAEPVDRPPRLTSAAVWQSPISA